MDMFCGGGGEGGTHDEYIQKLVPLLKKIYTVLFFFSMVVMDYTAAKSSLLFLEELDV